MTSDPSPQRLLEISEGFMASRLLSSAVELGVFSELAKQPKDERQLRESLKLHPRGARDFFDALTSLGLLRQRNGMYSNTRETSFYLDKTKPTYIGGILDIENRPLYKHWNSLTTALRTGNPASLTKDQELFDAAYSDPDKVKSFLAAMTGISMVPARVIAKKFPWTDYDSFFDIGSGRGTLPVQIASAHKHLTGGGFDLGQVKPVFEEYVKSFGLEKRLRFVSGDFFRDSLPRADVLVMGHILHDWSLEKRKLLIKKAFRSLRRNGALIVYESILDNKRLKNTKGLFASLNMLVGTQGGSEYTFEQGFRWMREAGFRKTYSEHLTGPKSMIVAIK